MEFFASIIVLLAVVMVCTNEYFQQKLGISPMPTVGRVRRAMIDEIPKDISGAIYEFGAGWGGLTFDAARAFPNTQIIALEYSIFPFMFLKLRRFFSPWAKNVTIARRDFFQEDISNAGAITCYLCIALMDKLEPKFKNELKPGAVVVSSTFPMPTWPAAKTQKIDGLWKVDIYTYQKTEGIA